ncbi:MAG: MarR family transcriptional regulator [Pseudomonadota bacterium]
MAFDKKNSAGYLANHMARLFALGLQKRLNPTGLATAQFMTLLELWNKDGLTQKQLVANLDVEQATMANTLARMERDGLVRRRPHPADARSQQVWLTAKARGLREAATDAASAQNRIALNGLSGDEQEVFLALMRRVIETMREQRDQPSDAD